jgi:hypothetical protein
MSSGAVPLAAMVLTSYVASPLTDSYVTWRSLEKNIARKRRELVLLAGPGTHGPAFEEFR